MTEQHRKYIYFMTKCPRLVKALSLLMIACMAPCVFAQEAEDQTQNSEESEKKRPDYGPAFDKLIALGLPETKGMDYGKFQNAEFQQQEMMFSSSDEEVLGAGLSGNGWRSPKKGEDGGYAFVHLNGQKFTSKNNSMVGRDVDSANTPPNLLYGQWSKVPIENDIKGAMDAIKAWKPNPSGYYSSAYSSNSSSNILLFAAQIWRLGFKDEANDLAWHLLTKTYDPQKVIDSTISKVANAQYSSLIESFKSTEDWKAYREGMLALVDKFPRGWSQREAIALVIVAIEERAKEDWSGPNLPTKLEGMEKPLPEELLAEVSALVDWKGNTDLRSLQYSMGNWVIDSSNSMYYVQGPLKKLLSQGIEAVPVLAAMLDNQTPLLMIKEAEPYYEMQSAHSDPSAIDTYQQGVTRPLTLDELARMLLGKVLPSMSDSSNNLFNNNQDNQPGADELRKEAITYYKSQRNASPSERIMTLIRGGDNQARAGLQKAMTMDDPELISQIEEHFLDDENLLEEMSLVRQYLGELGADGKDFFAKYEPLVKDAINEIASANPESDVTQHYKSEVEQLNLLVNPMSTEELVAKLQDPDVDERTIYTMLESGAGELGLERAIALTNIIDESAEVMELTRQVRIAYYAIYYFDAYSDDSTEEVDEEKTTATEDYISATREKWLKLLEDDRTVPGLRTSGKDVATSSAYMLLTAMGDADTVEQLNNIYKLIGEEASQFIIESTRALLNGSEPPEPPQKDSVANERVEEIKAKMESLESAELIQFRKGLELPEKIAFANIIHEMEKAPKGVADIVRTVSEVDIHPDTPIDLSWIKPGNMVDADMLKKIEELARSANQADKRIQVFVKFAMNGAGASVTAYPSNDNTTLETLGIDGTNEGFLLQLSFVKYNVNDYSDMIRSNVTITDPEAKPEEHQEYSEQIDTVFSDFAPTEFNWVLFMQGSEADALNEED